MSISMSVSVLVSISVSRDIRPIIYSMIVCCLMYSMLACKAYPTILGYTAQDSTLMSGQWVLP